MAAAAATAAVFSASLTNGFNWDDQLNLFINTAWRGVGPRQLRWMLSTLWTGNPYPLAWLSLALDYTVWGLRPFGYHLTNVVVHALNAALAVVLARRLLSRAFGPDAPWLSAASLAAALFFALHPLRVESVAWITERRDVLAGAFALATVLFYIDATERHGRARHARLALSIGFYVLALATKPIVMTLPFVLLVLDVYPLRRNRSAAVLVEKIPYVVLALAGASTALRVARESSLTVVPVSSRLAITGYGLWFYVEKTLLPVGLSPLYELPARVDALAEPYLAASIAVLAITAVLLALRRRWPAGLAVWVVYGMTVAPYLGIVHTGYQLVGARYTYLPTFGFALLLGGSVVVLARAAREGRVRTTAARAAAAMLALWLVALAGLSVSQITVWRNDATLWAWAVQVDPACALCRENLAIELYNRGDRATAITLIEHALALRPDRVHVHARLGFALFGVGRYAEAVAHFERFAGAVPSDPVAFNNLGAGLVKLGRSEEALPSFERALTLAPTLAEAWANRSVALSALGRQAEAAESRARAANIAGGPWRPLAGGPLRPQLDRIVLPDAGPAL